MATALWEPVDIKPDVIYGCKVGATAIRIKYSLHDWYVSTEAADEGSADLALKPLRGKRRQEPAEWSRWTSGEESLKVRLVPALPDRPVVVRPEASIKVPAKQRASFFVSIPIWVRITAGEDQNMTLCEVPTIVLSKTWFGDTTSGEPGYSLKTRAMRDISRVEPGASTATCPVVVNNASTLNLDFQRLCLHVENLALFRSERRLWTNQVNVLYRGEDQASQIDLSGNPPDVEGFLEKIAQPRVRPDKNLLKKSFQVVKMLTGLEGL